MDKMSNQSKISNVVSEAYELLLQCQIVEITETIRENLAEDATGWVFECVAKVPYPNQENIPSEVPLHVWVPEEFPHEPVDIYPICAEVNGFPHQDAESGKLCLPQEDLAPRDVFRLVCYIKWAIEWLENAAKGTLLKPGYLYELPDFSRKFLDSPLVKKLSLIFEESSNSYETWESHIGKFGDVECFWGSKIRALFAVNFRDQKGSLIRESEFSPNVLEKDSRINGKWVIMPDIRYKRHRPPQTYEEMNSLCSKNGMDFYRNLKAAWNLENPCKFGVLLVGFPIPEITGQDPTEIHWQPLFFENYNRSKKRPTKRRTKTQSNRQNQIWEKLKGSGCFSLSQQLPWGKVENVAHKRLYVRGAHPAKVQSTTIAFLGCGALGSSVAELLARGGVKQLNLFDPDSIQFGNLCRHTLDGSSIRLNKAVALAKRLSRANPLSSIQGYALGIPLNSHSDEVIRRVFAEADVLIDCTTSDTAFDWLNQYAIENDKRLISLFFNLRAELLTICISGNSDPCGDIFGDLNDSVRRNQTPIDPDVYFHEPSAEEEIMEGAGCWHATFPAQYAHVQILAAHAVDIISYFIDSKPQKGLAAIVERRSVLQDGVQMGPLVKVTWKKEY